jgi:hypothetical protein
VNAYVPPCGMPENDPNDWFIEKDGRQYSDESIFTVDEVASIWDLAYAEDLNPDEVLDEATQKRLKANLVKRRHAKDKCHRECKIRTQCLSQGMDTPWGVRAYGIWGGYYPEELRVIDRERRAHVRRRAVGARE